jgi:DeoR/GlpR family transcriptional regulator of sugar metabolism
LLEHEGNVKVENLAERFAVSQVTIRKDLAELEEQGLLQRTYGGAVFSHRSRFNISFIERVQLKSTRLSWMAALPRFRWPLRWWDVFDPYS